MKILVIPSNRQEQLTAFFHAWRGVGGWDEVVLIEDSPAVTFDTSASDKPVRHYSHAEVAMELGDNAWIISKGDSACRSFGFYIAWKMGAEYILTLDDDVRPCAGFEQIFDHHIRNMTHYSHFQSSAYGLWPRGMPSVTVYRKDVKASVGLWTGVPDMYASDILALGAYPDDYVPPPGKRLLPDGEFMPICGMNFCIHRDAVSACYFPLMGQGQKYSRYDDIWMGLFFKHALDKGRWKVCVGEPFVHHSRASDPVKCAEREETGKALNDELWRMFVDAGYPCQTDVFYVTTMGRSFQTWLGLFHD